MAKSIEYDFVWDDKVLIGPSLDVRGPADLARLWNTPFDSLLREPVIQQTYFRPLVLFSLALDRSQGGRGAETFHRTNLLLYALACVFLWLFAWEVSGRPVAATVGAVLFAVHPAHPESVVFISGRTDVLCGAFLFASLWAAARFGRHSRRAWTRLIPASALLLLALYSKEVALFAAPLLPLVLWLRERRIKAAALTIATLPVLAAIVVYFASRIGVVGHGLVPAASPVAGTIPQLLTSVAVAARYVPLLLFPISLSARHEVAPLARPDFVFVAGVLLLVAIAAGLFLTIRRRSMWSVPLFLFAATLLPLCSVRIIAGALVAERFLFIPSGALAIAVALLPGTAALLASGTFAAFFLALLLPRVPIWKDGGTLYTSMLRDSPNSPYVHAILGGYYYEQRNYRRAIEHHKRAFELNPEFKESLLNLGAAEEESGQVDSAFTHVRLLLRLSPQYAPAWYALGNLYARIDRPDSAASAYRSAVRLDPDLAQAENNLGVVLERMGRFEEAAAHYERALTLQPGYSDATNNLARLRSERAK